MKKSFLQISACVLLALCSSCNQQNPPSPDPAPSMQLAVIQLPTEIQKQVFVTPIVDSIIVDYSKINLGTLYYGEQLALYTPTETDIKLSEFMHSHLNIVGSNPYIILENGYAVIDWKWAHLHSLSGAFRNVLYWHPEVCDNKATCPSYSTNPTYQNGRLANEEYYLLPVQWEDLTDLNTTWKITEGQRIEKPEVRYVDLSSIEKYGSFQSDSKEMCTRYNVAVSLAGDLISIYNLYQQDEEKFLSFVTDLDALQSAYIETLNQMIRNKDFDKWCKVIQ